MQTSDSIKVSIEIKLPSVPIYLHSEPIDMRKSFDGLFGIIKNDLNLDVRDGGLFMFLNQRLNRLKILYWDTDGIAIWMKRLEQEGCSRYIPSSLAPRDCPSRHSRRLQKTNRIRRNDPHSRIDPRVA